MDRDPGWFRAGPPNQHHDISILWALSTDKVTRPASLDVEMLPRFRVSSSSKVLGRSQEGLLLDRGSPVSPAYLLQKKPESYLLKTFFSCLTVAT